MEMHGLEAICRMERTGSPPNTVLTVDGKIVQYVESESQDGRTTCIFKVEDQIKKAPSSER